MRNVSYVLAALIGVTTPSAAQDLALFTLGDALGIALEIGQAWPDDITTLREIVGLERAITWSDFSGIPGLSQGDGSSNDPWYGVISETSLTSAVSLNCIRTGRDRLASLREIDLLQASGDARDQVRMVQVFATLDPEPHWLEMHGVRTAWTRVPPEAVAALVCFLNLPLDAVPDPAAGPPEILTGLFDTVEGVLPSSDTVPGSTESFFEQMSAALGWRGPGPTGGLELLWYEDRAVGAIVAEDLPAMLTITVTSWLSPLGS